MFANTLILWPSTMMPSAVFSIFPLNVPIDDEVILSVLTVDRVVFKLIDHIINVLKAVNCSDASELLFI